MRFIATLQTKEQGSLSQSEKMLLTLWNAQGHKVTRQKSRDYLGREVVADFTKLLASYRWTEGRRSEIQGVISALVGTPDAPCAVLSLSGGRTGAVKAIISSSGDGLYGCISWPGVDQQHFDPRADLSREGLLKLGGELPMLDTIVGKNHFDPLVDGDQQVLAGFGYRGATPFVVVHRGATVVTKFARDVPLDQLAAAIAPAR